MYRIQKAVIKAKKNASGEKSVPRRPVNPAVDSPLENLSYSQTKVVPVEDGVLENNRIVAGFSNNHHSQFFRTLRTQVIQKMRQNKWQTLGITSPNTGEGKSLLAANLAIAIAREVNQTVLLVDLDLTNPNLVKCFDIEPEVGLLDFIKGKAKLEEVMFNPGFERLVVVPGRGSLLNSSEMITSPRMVSFFQETKARYKSRIIIFDMPPILPTDDVLSCMEYLDCSLMVLEDGKNKKKDLEKAIHHLKGTPFLGYILNKFHKGRWLI